MLGHDACYPKRISQAVLNAAEFEGVTGRSIKEMSGPDILCAAQEADPREDTFGFLGRDDNNLVPICMFHWFGTPGALLDVAVEVLPALWVGVEDAQGLIEKARQLRGDSGELSELLREELNKLLAGGTVIDWWGTFSDLCTSDNPLAIELREGFRSDLDEGFDAGNLESPILKDELPEFIEYIRHYGF